MVVLASATPAEARPRRERAASPPSAESVFWRELIDPNGAHVGLVIGKAREALNQLELALDTDAEWAVEQRLRYARDAYNMMRHARRLAPEHPEVLALLGHAADELGDTRRAIEAYEAAVRVTGRERAPLEVIARLGAIHLRLGEVDRAIDYLRLAQVSANLRIDRASTHANALVLLANALATRGQVAGAIDVLVNALPQGPLAHYNQPAMVIAFGLAVVYDRDEQRGAAFAVLDHLHGALASDLGPQLHAELAKLAYAPAEDRHYFRALLYEALGHYVEARAEWALYAASGGPWRARALDHVAAIDAQRRASPGPRGGPTARPAGTVATPPAIRRRIPRY